MSDQGRNGDDKQDWGGYRRQILMQLHDLQSSLAMVRNELQSFRQKELSDIKVEIALLKFKSSLWGGLLGTVGGALIATIAILSKTL